MGSILVVDKQKINGLMIKNIFINEYNVLEAENLLEAMGILEKAKIGMILLDLSKPNCDDFKFIKKVKSISKFRNIPFFVIIDQNDIETKDKAFALGVTNIFFNPVDEDFIKKTVSDYFLLGKFKAREAYFENIYNSLSCGVIHYKIKPVFIIKNINKKALELLGYSKKEVFEKNLVSLEALNHKYGNNLQNILEKGKKLKFGESFSYNCKVTLKGQEPRWIHVTEEIILDTFGEPLNQNILTDITQEKLLQEQLFLSETRNKLLLEQTEDLTFEWDCNKKTVHFFNDSVIKYGIKPKYDNFPETLVNSEIIYKSDRKSLVDTFMKIENENKDYNQEFRIVTPNNSIVWFEIISTDLKDENGKVKKILGLLRNIDSYKKRIEKAQSEARRDSLTGLYNRLYFENSSIEAIFNSKNGAMFIIDIDDFKNVNDSRGHLVGDKVLKSVSNVLKNIFKEKDIIARIGGDEFAVLLNGNIDLAVIEKKAQGIINAVLKLSKEDFEKKKISVSIGVCMFDKLSFKKSGVEIFNLLYKKADKAMYNSKNKGKSTFSIVQMENFK